METETRKDDEEQLDLGQPGFKLSFEKHKHLLEAVTTHVMTVFEEINKLPENNSSYKLKKKQFFGAHPVSLEKKHLKDIANPDVFHDFLVCEKTDGIRYLMYITNYGEVILSGRGDDFFLVRMPIPPAMVKQKEKEMSIMYIFDGELVIDERAGKKLMVYLLFDALLFNGDSVYSKPYSERLKYCLQFSSTRGDLFRLSKDLKIKRPGIVIDQASKFPRMKIAVKDFFQVDASAYIFNKMVPKLPHENDGLIFTRNSVPYPVGATNNIIKWKPPEFNTIDFLIVNNPYWENEYGRRILDLYVTRYNKFNEQNDYILFDIMVVDEETFHEIGEELDIREAGDDIAYKNAGESERKKFIAECKFDPHLSNEVVNQVLEGYLDKIDQYITDLLENSALSGNLTFDDDVRNNLHLCFDRKIKTMQGGWVIYKTRKDKNTPNAFNTAKNVFNCIAENITIEDIEREFENIAHHHQTDPHAQAQQTNGRATNNRPRMEEEPHPKKNLKTGSQ